MRQYTTLNFNHGETLDTLRDQVERFTRNEIAPIAEKTDRDNAFPNELWPRLGAMGLLGMTVSEEYGGSDMGYLAHVIAMEEISRAVPSYTWLTAIRAQPSSSPNALQPVFEIDGSAGNTLALTRFIQDLEASPFLRQVTLQTTAQTEDNGRKYYTFQLRASWEEPPAEALRTAPLFARTDSILQGD